MSDLNEQLDHKDVKKKIRIYEKGIRFERRCKKKLELEGYTVIRSAGSHGPFDLVAFNHHDIRLIQVKGHTTLGSKELDYIKSIECPPFVRKCIYLYVKHKREPNIFEP